MYTSSSLPPGARKRSPYEASLSNTLESSKRPNNNKSPQATLALTTSNNVSSRESALRSHHVEKLLTENKRSKQLLSDVQQQCESTISHLQSEHERMLSTIQNLQTTIQHQIEDNYDTHENSISNEEHEHAIQMFQTRTDAVQSENVELKGELERSVKQVVDVSNENADLREKLICATKGEYNYKIGELSDAPPEVMRQLTLARTNLADEERRNRMLQRTVDGMKPKAQNYVSAREQGKRLQEKVHQLEQQLRSVQRERDTIQAMEQQWSVFRKGLLQISNENDIVIVEDDDGMSVSAPPEIASITRRIRTLNGSLKNSNDQLKEAKSSLGASCQKVSQLEERLSGVEQANASLTKKLQSAKLDVMRAQKGEEISKAEASSMRALLETYEQMEKASTVIKKDSPTVAGLRASLSSAQKSNDALKEELEDRKKEVGTLKSEKLTSKAEYDRVVEKFGKLKNALFEEREKVKVAEERAVDAETLAGKGSYDNESTRVLHLQHNPLSQAIREKYEKELKAMKTELKRLKSRGDDKTVSSATSSVNDVDAQKLHQRLKESFKEQISLFREGVYLLTGYKVDMLADSDRPKFKVRSMYAEHEDDFLMFMWPEVKKDETITMLDLMNTKFAKSVSKLDDFDYVTKFKSVPGFMASLTMRLFEKQTFAG